MYAKQIRRVFLPFLIATGIAAIPINGTAFPGGAGQSSKRFVGKWAYWSTDGKRRYPKYDIEFLSTGKILVEGVVASFQIIDGKRIQMSYTGHDILYTYEFTKNGDVRLDTKAGMWVVHKGLYKRSKG